jgi:hypothetical protein
MATVAMYKKGSMTALMLSILALIACATSARASDDVRPLTPSEFAWLDTFLRSNLRFTDTAMNGKDARPLTLKLEKAYAFPLIAGHVDVFATCHAPGAFAVLRSIKAAYLLSDDYALEKVADWPYPYQGPGYVVRGGRSKIACMQDGAIVLDDDEDGVFTNGRPLRRTAAFRRQPDGGWAIAEEIRSPYSNSSRPLMPDGSLYVDPAFATGHKPSLAIPVDFARLGLDPETARVMPGMHGFVLSDWPGSENDGPVTVIKADADWQKVEQRWELMRVRAIDPCGSTLRIVIGKSEGGWEELDAITFLDPQSPMARLLRRYPVAQMGISVGGGGHDRQWAVETIGDLCVRSDTTWSIKHDRWFTTRLRIPDSRGVRVTDIRALGSPPHAPLIKLRSEEWPFGLMLFDSRAKRLIGRFQVSPTETYVYVLNYDAR